MLSAELTVALIGLLVIIVLIMRGRKPPTVSPLSPFRPSEYVPEDPWRQRR